MAFTSGNDINILQGTDALSVGAGAGDDRYVLDASTLNADQQITISDAQGANTLQLVGGLEIVSSQVTGTAVQLVLNNGAKITVLGANTFNFQTGGNPLNGTGGLVQNFADFVTLSLGLAEVPTGNTPVEGGTVTVQEAGGTEPVDPTNPTDPTEPTEPTEPVLDTYEMAAAKLDVNEGEANTFTVTAIGTDGQPFAVTADTTVTLKVIPGSTTAADQGTETTNLNDFGAGAFNLVTKTIAAGQSSVSFDVTTLADSFTELTETYQVEVKVGELVFTKTINVLDGAIGAGQTYTLTTGIDNINGTSGNDTIGATIIKNQDTGTTLNAGDNINGGAGTDTLLISATGDVNVSGGATVSAFVLNGVEKVLVSNFASNSHASGGGPLTLDLSTADSALTTLGLTSSVTGSATSGNTFFSNVGKIVEAEMKNGGGNLSISYAAAAIAGATDVQNLTLSGATDTTGNEPTFDANGIETLNIASTGSANSIKIGTSSSASLATVNVTGDKALVVDLQGATNTAIKTVDASAATGNVTLKNLADATSLALNVKTGTGDDTVYLGAGVTSNDSIDAGTGTDTLVISGTDTLTAANLANVTGFETVKIENTTSGGNASYAVDTVAGVTKVVVGTVGSGGSGAASVDLTNLAATTAVVLNAVNTDTTGVRATLKNNTAADTATVTIGAATATTSTGVTVAKLDLGQFETINLTSTGGTSTAANQVTALTATAATSLVLTGDRDLAFGDASGSGGITAASLKSIDASAMTGKFTMNAAGSIGANATIKGGSAADVILGGSGNDSLVGGAGNDSITGNGGNDTIDAGDGADVITVGSGSANVLAGAGDDTIKISSTNLTSSVTIAGGDGTDFLQFSDFAGSSGSGSISLTGASSAKISNLTSVETLGVDMTGVTGSGTFSLAIDDATVAAAGGTLTFKATSAAASGASAVTKLDAGSVVLSSSKVIADMSAINNVFSYVVGNGTENIKGSNQNDTVTVGTVAYLSANDTINAGNGTDTLAFTQTSGDASITAAQLANVSGFETVTLGASGGTNKLTLTLTDAVLAANNSNSAISVNTATGSFATGSGGINVDASSVTSIYSVNVTGGTGTDTIKAGAGNDIIIGGAGNDTIDLSAGGTDRVRIENITTNGKDVIKGFTLFGTGSTGATGYDIIQIAAGAGASGSGGVVVSGGADLSSGSAITSGSATALEAVKLVSLTSTNVSGASATADAIFVLKGIGVQNTGVSGDSILTNVASGAKGMLMYYNTATQMVELASFDAGTSDSTVTGNELTVLAQFDGVTLTGLAGVTAANFELFGV